MAACGAKNFHKVNFWILVQSGSISRGYWTMDIRFSTWRSALRVPG